jgi:hypothetical protein
MKFRLVSAESSSHVDGLTKRQIDMHEENNSFS